MIAGRRRRQPARGGSALLLALVCVAVVALISASLLRVTASVTAEQAHYIDDRRAFYLAETGLAEAYYGLRNGSTGQIGTNEAPARAGAGLVWVDAEEIDANHVRLESHGFCRSGRASLAMVVEVFERPLGIFSNRELVIDGSLLLDGFDSGQSSYSTQVRPGALSPDPGSYFVFEDLHDVDLDAYGDPDDVDLDDYEKDDIVYFDGAFYLYETRHDGETGPTFEYTHVVDLLDFPELWGTSRNEGGDEHEGGDDREGGHDHEGGADDAGSQALTAEVIQAVEEADLTFEDSYLFGAFFEQYAVARELLLELHTTAGTGESVVSVGGPTTGSDGLLGSNAGVVLREGLGETIEVFGDVVPGPGASADVGTGRVTGATDPRSEDVELPPVVIPDLVLEGPVDHGGAIPFQVPAGSIAYESIHVRPGSELTLEGPLTLVAGHVQLDEGARLAIDNSAGPVTLVVTDGIDLDPGSTLTVASHSAPDMLLQVAGDTGGAELHATSQFRGVIYAPEATVSVTQPFEVFGSIVADSVELGPDVRVHFDEGIYGGSRMVLPRFVSWTVTELPPVARNRKANPLDLFPSSPDKLPTVHDGQFAKGWTLRWKYYDHDGVVKTYEGPLSGLDPADVAGPALSLSNSLTPPDVDSAPSWNLRLRYKQHLVTGERLYEGPVADWRWWEMERPYEITLTEVAP